LHLGRRSRRPGGDRGGKSLISNFETSNFHKSKSTVQARNSIKIHNTKDKDLRIYRNAGGTVLPLIAGGDRGGKSVISNFESSNFHKSKSSVQARNSIKIHNTKDKDLRIFKNSGGTVLPLIAGGDRGGKSVISNFASSNFRKSKLLV
jgi:GTP-sensing pleiotropic transcriptional regulator CodY